MEQTSDTARIAQDVRRRKVFYIPGFDPFPARRYREIYRREGTEQARLSGYTLELGPGGRAGRYGWQVRSTQDGQTTDAQVEVLVWSDIVQASMASSIAGTYRGLLRTAWLYIGTGTLWRLMRMRKGPVIAALYPVGMLFLQLIIALLVGAALAALLGGGWAILAGALPAPVTLVLLLAVTLCVAILLLRWFKTLDRHFYAHYLMQDYAYSASLRGRTPPELVARLAQFGDRLAAALADDYDEVLVVGHSSGAHIGVEILADHLRRAAPGTVPPALSLLTLGHVIPMISFLPEADKLRADLAFLSTRADITWIDVTAPGDGCAFALCDPVAVSGVAPSGQRWPVILSAAFTQTLSPQTWRRLRWRFFRLHFQYLHAFDRPRDYDYFRVTAGPLSLGRRFAGRESSKSRIDRPLSRYTSMAA